MTARRGEQEYEHEQEYEYEYEYEEGGDQIEYCAQASRPTEASRCTIFFGTASCSCSWPQSFLRWACTTCK
jgi:hypothetical protein